MKSKIEVENSINSQSLENTGNPVEYDSNNSLMIPDTTRMIQKGVIITLAGMAIVTIPVINSLLAYFSNRFINVYVSFIPNILILIASYIIRFFLLDIPLAQQHFADTAPFSPGKISVKRYANFMLAAMNVGFAATIVIYTQFIAGAALYFIMHIFLVAAFTQILFINPIRIYTNDKKLFTAFMCNLAIWGVIVPTLFFAFVWRGPQTLIFFPYAVMLGLMAAVITSVMFYRNWPIAFRIIASLGAFMFVISDFLIGFVGEKDLGNPFLYMINPTYILAIFLLSAAQLFVTRKIGLPGAFRVTDRGKEQT